MLTDERRLEISIKFASEIEGGVTKDFMQIIDEWVEDGFISQEEYDLNEMAIAGIFDDGFFTCNGCGWTMPVCEMSSDSDWECNECAEDEYDDD